MRYAWMLVALLLAGCGSSPSAVFFDVSGGDGSGDAGAPEEDVAEEDVAEEDVAEEDVPEEDVTEEDVPEEDVTEQDVSEEDVSEEDVAEEDVSEEDVSEEDVSEEDVSGEDVSEEDVSEEDVAEEDVAEEDVSEEDVAEEDVSEEDVAEEDVPEEDVAEEDVPEEDVAEEDVPEEDTGETWTFDPVAQPESAELFPLSVQAGAMRATSVLLWTQVSTGEEVALRVWQDTDEGRILVFEGTATPAEAGYTHAPVEGLTPGTEYQYAFFGTGEDGSLGERSAIGRFLTAWGPGVRAPITVAATSCTNQSFRPLDAIERMAEREDIQLFLHMGDQHYNDGSNTLEEFRNDWRSQLNERSYREMHEAVGFYQTWDDHEVDNDYDPTSISPSTFANAEQAFYESFAIERGPGDGLWNSYVWGDTAEFIILDSRSERYVPTEDYYISQAQMDWFLERLSSSTAHFKVVLNSVPITDMPGGYFGEGDRWEGYDGQRDQVINHIVDNDIRNVWFLSGDFHIGMVTRVNNDGGGRRIHEIAAGPGGNTNPAASLLDTLEFFSGVDQQIFHTGSFDTQVQTVLTFDPDRNEVLIRFIDADGEVLYEAWLAEGS